MKTITKEQVLETIKKDVLIEINHIYLPHLGKTKFTPDGSMVDLSESNLIGSGRLAIQNNNRTEDGARYNLYDGKAVIDFGKMKITGEYLKQWEGGLTERMTFSHNISEMYGVELVPTALKLDITGELGN